MIIKNVNSLWDFLHYIVKREAGFRILYTG